MLTQEQGIFEVECITYLILKQGGMAVKSTLDEIMMIRHGLEPAEARGYTNGATEANLRLFRFNPLRWASLDHPEPTTAQFPEVLDFRPLRRYRTNERGRFRLRRQFHEITLIYRERSMLTEDAVMIANDFWFLVPMNEVFSAAQLAEAMEAYSTDKKVQYLAGVLKGVAQREAVTS